MEGPTGEGRHQNEIVPLFSTEGRRAIVDSVSEIHHVNGQVAGLFIFLMMAVFAGVREVALWLTPVAEIQIGVSAAVTIVAILVGLLIWGCSSGLLIISGSRIFIRSK